MLGFLNFEGLIDANQNQANLCEVHKGRNEVEDDWAEVLADLGVKGA